MVQGKPNSDKVPHQGSPGGARKADPGLGASPEQLHPLSSHSLVGLRLELALPWSVTYTVLSQTNPFSLPDKPVSYQLPLLQGGRLIGTQSSDQSCQALTSSHTPPSPPFLTRSVFLKQQLGAPCAPAKPRTFHLAFKTPDSSSLPRRSGNIFGLSLEAAKQCGEDSEPKGQAQSENPTQTCLIPGPASALTHCKSLRWECSPIHMQRGGLGEKHKGPYERGVQKVKDSQNMASLDFPAEQ